MDKIEVLFRVMEMQSDDIIRQLEQEYRLFQWSTGLLLAAFGLIATLATIPNRVPFPPIAKMLGSAMILVPLTISIVWILRRPKRAEKYAEVFERIEELLHLFEEGYYGSKSPLPKDWQGKLAKNIRKRKTPIYYSSVLGIMTICVIIAIWGLL